MRNRGSTPTEGSGEIAVFRKSGQDQLSLLPEYEAAVIFSIGMTVGLPQNSQRSKRDGNCQIPGRVPQT